MGSAVLGLAALGFVMITALPSPSEEKSRQPLPESNTAVAQTVTPATASPSSTTSSPTLPVVLSSTSGSVFIATQTEKTTCQLTREWVMCAVAFIVPTPESYGVPANG